MNKKIKKNGWTVYALEGGRIYNSNKKEKRGVVVERKQTHSITPNVAENKRPKVEDSNLSSQDDSIRATCKKQ